MARRKRRKKPRLGSGKRFRKLVKKFKKGRRRKGKRKGIKSPRGLAAYIGRKKYGKRRFQKMAARGKRRRNPIKRGALLGSAVREDLLQSFAEGAFNEAWEEWEDQDKADRAARIEYNKLNKKSDKALIKYAFEAWPEMAEKYLGHPGEWGML